MSHSPRAVSLAEIDLPEFGEPTVEPQFPAATYGARLDTLLARARAAGWDAIVVYGDREHLANVALSHRLRPALRGGAAGSGARPHADAVRRQRGGWSYTELAPGPFERRCCSRVFPCPASRAIATAISWTCCARRACATACRIGAAGWKGFDELDPGADAHWLEIPSYLADALRRIAGGGGVVNTRPTSS